ncbi:MAG: winged helix-turn-helix transcriptional regulator [Mycobacterium sp.]|nr:winged helix-turn-helix transcriptional regulator [Mycobacterium sp.]
MPKRPGPPLGLLLANTAKIVNQVFDSELAKAGGSRPVWLIMITVKTLAPENQRELAEAVGIEGATLTHHLNAMEKQGLITRRRDPGNRRIHQVELTDAGLELFHQLASTARTHDKRLRAHLSGNDAATLERLLRQLHENVSCG